MMHAALQLQKFESAIGDQRLSIDDKQLARLVHLSRVRHSTAGPTAKSFSDWVYRLEHPKAAPAAPRSRCFLQAARRQISNVLDRNADKEIGGWELLSCDDGTKSAKVYESACLAVGDRPLRLKPDAVFRHPQTGAKIVFEYKIVSPGVSLPVTGWPNLAVQLWAYSLANPWANDANVMLSSALFNWNGIEAELSETRPRTIKTDREFFLACATLFQTWGGALKPGAIANRDIKKLLHESRR